MKKVYGLKTVKADGTSYGGFQFLQFKGTEKKTLKTKIVKCSDWDATPQCGDGLHFLKNGYGDAGLLDWNESAIWIAISTTSSVVDIDSLKSKSPQLTVETFGDRKPATDWLIAHGCDASKVIGAFLTGGDGSTLTGGDRSTLTGGDYSTLTGGDGSTLTGKYWDGTRFL